MQRATGLAGRGGQIDQVPKSAATYSKSRYSGSSRSTCDCGVPSSSSVHARGRSGSATSSATPESTCCLMTLAGQRAAGVPCHQGRAESSIAAGRACCVAVELGKRSVGGWWLLGPSGAVGSPPAPPGGAVTGVEQGRQRELTSARAVADVSARGRPSCPPARGRAVSAAAGRRVRPRQAVVSARGRPSCRRACSPPPKRKIPYCVNFPALFAGGLTQKRILPRCACGYGSCPAPGATRPAPTRPAPYPRGPHPPRSISARSAPAPPHIRAVRTRPAPLTTRSTPARSTAARSMAARSTPVRAESGGYLKSPGQAASLSMRAAPPRSPAGLTWCSTAPDRRARCRTRP